MEAVLAIFVWVWWLMTIARGPVWSWAVLWYFGEEGTRTYRFWLDWGFLVYAPFIGGFGLWPPLWPRWAIVVVVTVAVTVWRLRSEDTWRPYEPPLRSPDLEQ